MGFEISAKAMGAESWIVKMGNHVSSNFRSATLLEPVKKKAPKSSEATKNKQTVGILCFEVANAVSKIVHLHQSLTDLQISKPKKEISNTDGVRNLVSSDEVYLLELALTEKLGELNQLASVVSRLGKRCVEPALQGFEHVYSDIVSGGIEVKDLGFLVKDISRLQHLSLWNQTYEKVVELLAWTVCTVYARICLVFGDVDLKKNGATLFQGRILQPEIDDHSKLRVHLERASMEKRWSSFKPLSN